MDRFLEDKTYSNEYEVLDKFHELLGYVKKEKNLYFSFLQCLETHENKSEKEKKFIYDCFVEFMFENLITDEFFEEFDCEDRVGIDSDILKVWNDEYKSTTLKGK